MMRRLIIFVAVSWLPCASALAQEVDARAALLASMEAMGADELATIEYSGAGFLSRIGQQYSVNGGWPTFQVVDYTRGIDFDAGWSREDYTRQQGDYPTFGRTPMAPVRVTAVVNGAYAWDIRGDEPVPLLRPYLDPISTALPTTNSASSKSRSRRMDS